MELVTLPNHSISLNTQAAPPAVNESAPATRRAAPTGIEYRSITVSALRSEKAADGAQYLTGYAANYNVLSHNLGGSWYPFRERIMPGAFKRAVDEKQDVFHLVNHDPSQILGRTTAGTTTLSEDGVGLAFRTLINPEDHHAVNFAARVARKDISECSFGFIARGQRWVTERDPDNPKETVDVRELSDLDLFDVSTVTYPAYPQTHTALAAIRSAGDTIPDEMRSRILARVAEQRKIERATLSGVAGRDVGDDDPSMICGCDCLACQDGECEDCMNEACMDEACMGCGARSALPATLETRDAKTKKVDGEDLTSDCFIIVGDADDPSTWKLPWKFSTDEKTKSHLRNALARFNQMKSVSDETKKAAWDKLVKLCKVHGIDVSDEENKSIRARLTEEQIASFSAPSDEDIAAQAAARERLTQTLLLQSNL